MDSIDRAIVWVRCKQHKYASHLWERTFVKGPSNFKVARLRNAWSPGYSPFMYTIYLRNAIIELTRSSFIAVFDGKNLQGTVFAYWMKM